MNTRPATLNDFEFVYQVKVDALKDYIRKTWGWDEDFQREFHQKDFTPENMKIIVDEGHDAGVLVVTEDDNQIRVNEIYLLRKFQRKGIGSSIISEIQAESEQKNKCIWLQVLRVNPATKLYKRMGFKIFGETETHYQMKYGEPVN